MTQLPMVKIHVLGHRRHLDEVLDLLYRQGTVHLVDVTHDRDVHLPPLSLDEDHVRRVEDLRYLRTRLESVLALAPGSPPRVGVTDDDIDRIRLELDEEAPHVDALAQRLDSLTAEQETLPRYLESLRKLLPLVPELTELQGYETVALLIDARHAHVLGDVNGQITELIGANFTILSDQVDADTIGAVLVFPKHHGQAIRDLLGHEPVSRVRLPARFEGIPFRKAIAAMETRLGEIPVELESTSKELERLVASHPDWPGLRALIDARIAQLEVIDNLGATAHTYVISGWIPRRDLPELRHVLEARIGKEVIVEEVEPLAEEAPPVVLDNPAPARPFETLVKLLALPRYGAIDPTVLMTIFLPLFFGMMLGDVAYGLILLGIAWWVRRRFGGRSRIAADLSSVFLLSAGWATVWGIVYGELFGDLGRRLFDWHPIWIDREEALEPLLLFAVAVGAAHIVLGLLLGTWQALRTRDRQKLQQRVATLVALAGLFLIVAVAAGRLPAGFVTPGAAAIIVGLAMLIVAEGAMGAVTAPLELIGTVGNILSYLRIAAIGLASVYLARVANELGATGPLWLGLIVASLFHALNVALGAFSPTIQSLRLHYVEFFGKFYEEGGSEYVPFGEPPERRASHPSRTGE